MKKEKPVVLPNPKKFLRKKKKYTIEIVEYMDGSSTLNRRNSGFNLYELLGLVDHLKEDLLRQASPKPTITEETKACKQPDGKWKML